jgi:glycosyltransferase involved in cell wall biosynthesis
MRRVHQFVATLTRRDAIGEHTLAIQKALRDEGVAGEIYAGRVNPDARGLGRHHHDADDEIGPDDLVLYHHSTGTPVAEHVLDLGRPIVLDYHNVTPPEFFADWEYTIAAELTHGRRQLRRLSLAARLGIGDSSFNESELIAAGCAHTTVVPILFDPDALPDPDPTLVETLRARQPGPRWLFVGRIAPNKAQHDLICALAIARRIHDPRTHLTLIGTSASTRYRTTLDQLITHLDLTDAITFTGSVSDDELAAHYTAANIFTSASDHEGFCVPLLEAMHYRLPIVAHAAAAVPETLDNAGLLYTDKRPATLATIAHHITTHPDLTHQLTHAGTQRLTHYHPDNTRTRLLTALQPLLQEGVHA